ncbi:hypothetical protein O181_039135 [Austropuccinia psidii MF-1]|uniref:Retroviral polymerase SH3-like domain-containing protein n=1 Tax=Austropuccinia psidii MF-1 TaxID=1389203 RepID=A0A9Q3HEV2_9BASI|nr:hypothetical protein [Austropuccinia psidii MF-1]
MSPPENPQHKGFSEEANSTIIEKARCLLNRSDLPKKYLEEAINTSVFLSNSISTPSFHDLCPYFLWNKTPPCVKSLRKFGFRAIVAIPGRQQEQNLWPVGLEGVFPGYENNNTSYRALHINMNKVIISRHVEFDEFFFPHVSSASPSSENLDFSIEWGDIRNRNSK